MTVADGMLLAVGRAGLSRRGQRPEVSSEQEHAGREFAQADILQDDRVVAKTKVVSPELAGFGTEAGARCPNATPKKEPRCRARRTTSTANRAPTPVQGRSPRPTTPAATRPATTCRAMPTLPAALGLPRYASKEMPSPKSKSCRRPPIAGAMSPRAATRRHRARHPSRHVAVSHVSPFRPLSAAPRSDTGPAGRAVLATSKGAVGPKPTPPP